MQTKLTKYQWRAYALAVAICSALLVSACSDARGRASVMARFPGADVAMVPDRSGEWIIRQPDGSVWYARCNGINDGGKPDWVNAITELIPKR